MNYYFGEEAGKNRKERWQSMVGLFFFCFKCTEGQLFLTQSTFDYVFFF